MKLQYLFILTLLAGGRMLSQIPILNSSPAIGNKVIYLDFDGQKVTGTAWNNGNTVNALASTASSNNIRLIWQRISEDYRPFNVNVTTDSMRFNNAMPNSRIRVVFTPTSAWYGSAGGVAYLGSFTWGGYPGTPCWVFENQLGYNSKSMAEAAAHEVGHTLSLYHQSTYNSACTKTNEYNPGVGNGVTSWAPIMGVGYSKNVTIWHNGSNANGCNTIQNDHGSSTPGITGNNFLSFLPDDVGDNAATAKILNLTTTNLSDSGLITTPADVDFYRFTICNSRYISVNVRPWALDSTPGSYLGADLDVKLKLFNSSNTLIAADSSTSKLNGLLGMTLNAGTYYFTVDGGSSTNYSDYGSLGKYYVRVKATNPPQMVSSIVTPANLCSGQNAALSYTANGSPTAWQWNITGPVSGSFAVANPSFNFSTPGVYTVSLLATSSASSGCATTQTFNVGALPALSIIGTQTVLCPQKTGSLSATGATSYTWLPVNIAGPSLIANPTITTTYTLIGANGTCSNTAVSTLSVSPNFTLSIAASSSVICPGSSATLTGNGAMSYTFNPGNIASNPAVVSPTFNTNYTVTANNNGCLKTGLVLVKVSPVFNVSVFASDTLVCMGETISLTSSGANTYTIDPGGLTGNYVVISPSTSAVYTITGANINQCLADTTLNIYLDNCDMTAIKSVQAGSRFRIYPNPASGAFMIEGGSENYEVSILNALGLLVYSRSVEGQPGLKVDASEWSKGVYFIRLTSEGKTSSVKLIVK